MDCVKITPWDLFGIASIPPSKSLCHRAVIAAGLSNEKCTIENIVYSQDIEATCAAMSDMGVDIERQKDSITIKGNNLINSIKREIDCGESASTLRFLIPVALLTSEEITFTGGNGLKNRPLGPYYRIFKNQGIKIEGEGSLPLTVNGVISPGDYEIEGNISSQFITGLMFALPLLDGDSRIIVTTELESRGYVDLTMDILKKFSIDIENNNYKEFYIKGGQHYAPSNYRVEGDFSQAAFWMVAGILGNEVTCKGLEANSLQGDRRIIDILKEMGGRVSINKDRIVTSASKTAGITIDGSQIPDLVPILAVLASVSQGTTEIINAKRLRIKESDRLHAIAAELGKLGADITEREDGLIIKGKHKLKGGVVDSWNDHRIAMALSIASIKCDEPVIIKNSSSVKKSYPEFFNDFSMLGGMVEEISMD